MLSPGTLVIGPDHAALDASLMPSPETQQRLGQAEAAEGSRAAVRRGPIWPGAGEAEMPRFDDVMVADQARIRAGSARLPPASACRVTVPGPLVWAKVLDASSPTAITTHAARDQPWPAHAPGREVADTSRVIAVYGRFSSRWRSVQRPIALIGNHSRCVPRAGPAPPALAAGTGHCSGWCWAARR